MLNKGDDTDAFGFSFLSVDLEDAEGYTITKAEIRIGAVTKIYNSPVFPISVKLSKQETLMLSEGRNECYLAVYDDKNKKHTCAGGLVFPVEPKVV